MNKIHDYLCRSHQWYDAWHKDYRSSAVAWLAFAFVAVAYAQVTVSVIQNNRALLQSDQIVASVGAAFENRGGAADPEGRLLQNGNAALTKVNAHALSAPGKAGERLAELRVALEERFATLNEIALTNPQEVRRFVLDEKSFGTIPESARDLVEKPFAKKGVFHIALVTEELLADGEVSHEEYLLEVTPGEVYRLALTPEEAYALPAEETIEVTGAELDDMVVVPSATVAMEAVDGEPQVLGASSVKNIAVIAFNFRDDLTQNFSVDELTKRYFTNTNSLAAHMRENSAGQWDITGTVFGWYTLNLDAAAGCNYSAWVVEADKAVAAAGMSLTGYTHKQYIFPSGKTGCGWGGLAYMPGTVSWVVGSGAGAGISVHELGHNYGFHHAATPTSEYGDGSDPMGGAKSVHYSNYNKGRFWLTSDKYTTVNSAGTYTLKELKSADGVVGIRVPRKDGTTNHFMLEYRGNGGFDNAISTTYLNKLLIRVVPSTFTVAKTSLVSILGAGQSYDSTVDGITFTVVNATSTEAMVKIDMVAAPCTAANPTVTATPSGQWGAPGQALTYTVSVKNNDSATCSSSNFTVSPTLPSGFVQNPATVSLSLLPGEQKSATVSVTSPLTAVPATYVIQQVAQNTASVHTGTASVNYNIAAADATLPTVTISTPTNGARITGSKTSVSATASDSSGISSLQLQINGQTVKTCTGVTVCTYSWNVRRIAAGTHTIKAIAIDNSVQKNRSETSVSVTK
jgi:uncharacterized repeat protein (TIGR01451 family)